MQGMGFTSPGSHMRYVVFAWIFALMLAAGLLGPGAAASDIRTYPTRVTLTPTAAIGSVMVKNNNTTKSVMQLEVVSWRQENGEDIYEPTREILVNPVIFDMAPGAEQVVRLGLQTGVADTERSYRLFLQEIPARDAPPQQGITTLLRIGIPVFVPPKQTVGDLAWQANVTPSGKIAIEAANKGTVHIQVTQLALTAASGEAVSKDGVFAYILPGQSRRWDITPKMAARPGQPLTLDAATDFQDFKTQVVVGTTVDRAKQN